MSVYQYINIMSELCQKHEQMSLKEYQYFITIHFGFYEFEKRPLREIVELINERYKTGLFDKDLSERPLFLEKRMSALET